MIITDINIGAAVSLCTLTVFFSDFKSQIFSFTCRPGIKLEIVCARPNLELVPGTGAENLSAIVQGFSYLSKLES